jgi:hypothetical protein
VTCLLKELFYLTPLRPSISKEIPSIIAVT